MKFRILAGVHVTGKQIYRKGEVVTSEVDLVEKFGKNKFEKVAESTPEGPDYSDLPEEPTKTQILKMSITQLRALAQRDGVSELLEGITKKGEMAELMVAHYFEN